MARKAASEPKTIAQAMALCDQHQQRHRKAGVPAQVLAEIDSLARQYAEAVLKRRADSREAARLVGYYVRTTGAAS